MPDLVARMRNGLAEGRHLCERSPRLRVQKVAGTRRLRRAEEGGERSLLGLFQGKPAESLKGGNQAEKRLIFGAEICLVLMENQ